MNTQQAYDAWSSQYDSNDNKTRDLEAYALRTCLADISFHSCLEIGCGTGKNTIWFVEKAKQVTAIDLSAEMLTKAKEKITSSTVEFKQADILSDWSFTTLKYDLVSFSLILEHIEHLEPIVEKAANALNTGGHLYIGELHPFKQYTGSKARFDTKHGTQVVECYNHHISDFTRAAQKHGFQLTDINEYFDDDNKNSIPRILTLLFVKV